MSLFLYLYSCLQISCEIAARNYKGHTILLWRCFWICCLQFMRHEGMRSPAVLWLLHFSFYQFWVLSWMYSMLYMLEDWNNCFNCLFILLGKWKEVVAEKKIQYIKLPKLSFGKANSSLPPKGIIWKAHANRMCIFLWLKLWSYSHTVFHFVFTINYNCSSFQLNFHLCSFSLESH